MRKQKERKDTFLPFEYFCNSWHEPRFKRMKKEWSGVSRHEEEGGARDEKMLQVPGKRGSLCSPLLKERFTVDTWDPSARGSVS